MLLSNWDPRDGRDREAVVTRSSSPQKAMASWYAVTDIRQCAPHAEEVACERVPSGHAL
jgi:hypothetical protein